jgi:peptidoglycan/LPS O-acetylase OafA/YrhL
MNRKKIGNLLTLLGVLAWVPFLYLIAIGQEPSIFPFLIVHLTGVLIGSQLRRSASPSRGKLSRRQLIGRIMIILGVIAWAPYLYQKELLSQPIEITPYLTVHLTGVLGGIALMLSVPLTRYLQGRLSPASPVADELDPTG